MASDSTFSVPVHPRLQQLRDQLQSSFEAALADVIADATAEREAAVNEARLTERAAAESALREALERARADASDALARLRAAAEAEREAAVEDARAEEQARGEEALWEAVTRAHTEERARAEAALRDAVEQARATERADADERLRRALEDALERAHADLAGRLAAEREEAARTLKHQLDSVQAQADEQVEAARAATAAARAEMEAARAETVAAVRDASSVKERFAALKDELAQAQAEAARASDELFDHQVQVAQLNENLDAANAQAAQAAELLQAAKSDFASATEQLAAAKTEVARTTQDLAAAKAEVARAMEELAAARAAASQVADAARSADDKDLRQARAAAAQATRDLAEAQERLSELESELASVKDQSDRDLNALRARAAEDLAAANARAAQDLVAARAQVQAENPTFQIETNGGMAAVRQQAIHDLQVGGTTTPDLDSSIRDAHVAERQCDLECMERLVSATRDLEQATTLSDVLDRLTGKVQDLGIARSALFIAHGSGFRGWKLSGFGDADADPSGITIDLAAPTVVGRAAQTGQRATTRDNGDHPVEGLGFAPLPDDRVGLAVPLSVGNRTVAVLYADDLAATPPDVPSAWPEALEVLARHAARCLELLTIGRAYRLHTVSTVPESRPAPGMEQAASFGPVDTAPLATGEGAAEDESAQRYARLLISEIKLYHEDVVNAGRRDRNLLGRLAPEIARARKLYEQRVAPGVRARADFFGQELVRTLANGDPRLLGLGT